jgi:hypothetical protein
VARRLSGGASTPAADPLPVAVVGLGPIGIRIARRVAARERLALAAAVDVAPDKLGADLGELIGADAGGLRVTETAAAAPPGGIAVLATGSRLEAVADLVGALVGAGWDVVSTCEELVHPRSVDESRAQELDAVARRAGRTVVGAGINPGFLLDALPLVLSGVCTEVTAVRARRVVDTNARRRPLQEKAGVGLTVADFDALRERRAIGHVGLRQSAFLVADSLDLPLDRYEEELEPVVAAEETATGLGPVPAGGVIGQHQLARGFHGGAEVVRLDLTMAAGAAGVDEVEIDGEPPVLCVLEGGVNGDVGTEAVVVNLLPAVAAAPPGLLTIADLLPLRCRA